METIIMSLMGMGVAVVVLIIGIVIGVIALAIALAATNVGRKTICSIVANRIMKILWTRKPGRLKRRA